ncbi:hypothetical protein R5W23_003206 [Gemmata sp. JC673]|uniref:SMODS and SLOG-associating 2TM effector domain-containing protein n=1 Tax=Gemmata algarum TaxID=2975278 RepID=A0ABU5F662_9BACT|nr:hypothetical protein [Gemmata algarum]MDY3561778.1 hypothetical protein [Gemmata algarum]
MAPPDDPIPLPADQSPAAKLTRNIRQVCRRVVRGKAATTKWQVRLHLALRVVSIALSSLGSAGVIVDKVSGNLPGEAGWAFWGSVIVLLFGILLQVANEFRVAQIAADSRLLAERCALYETQLEDMLISENPVKSVADLLFKICELLQNERYNAILPAMTPDMETTAERWAVALIATNQAHWQLDTRRTARGKGTPQPPPAEPKEPTAEPEGERDRPD